MLKSGLDIKVSRPAQVAARLLVSQTQSQFTRVQQHERCLFFGNVTLGSSVTLPELRELYDVVVLAYGAESDRVLGSRRSMYSLF
ncbi:hypothetical protein M0R45_003375 [Rubus argutus]|uniref:Uncharacterized protein n=1 Tax=Rubus argutus TaxID=59490 RepID=A0AAW1YFA1_RUBAR